MNSVAQIYDGSDGSATKELYQVLAKRGPLGLVALNLFRAQKSSSRAKVYHGGIPGKGSYRDMAYNKKQFSMTCLCQVLKLHAEDLGISWGWKSDPAQPIYKQVLYVNLPNGQVSFHTEQRGDGPDYPGEWDNVHASAERIVQFVEKVLGN